jgi:hypothetical protein
LNRLPELKSFLKSGEAESYKNVEIEYIHGRKATLTIFHDNVQVEKVELSLQKTQQNMHELFVSKGFVLKSKEEISVLKKERQAAIDAEQKALEERKLAKNLHGKERREMMNMDDRPKPSSRSDAGNSDDKRFFLKEQRRKQDEMDREIRRKEMEKRQAEKFEKLSKSEQEKQLQQRDRIEREKEKRLAENLEKMSESKREAYLKRKEEAKKRRETIEKGPERRQQNDEL